ncbi:telomeric repeat-binding factor 2-like isoform X2 [Toxotes jaculatrix]|uniref:telomeric repeat-binding factor 2-like isoform X2 n=1 Tax=Toxotes jaculatrix TaxID=941984 RepID=UPI001B3AF8AF|nr:telomeric repeat-binding factor 2-like isoform X2 [Toxotes jaculatrix]
MTSVVSEMYLTVSVLARPLQSTDVLPTKILVLQFLSRIKEGESLDVYFESDQSITPLESALKLLEKMSQGCNIPQQDYENVCTSVREMMVGIFIKNNEFAKAKEVLIKYFPKPMVGKKAVFMGLISKKSKMHKVIEKIDFRQFREEMLAFCQRLCPVGVPFLHKAAQQHIDKRLTEQDDKAAAPDEQMKPDPSYYPQINTTLFAPYKHTTIQRTRLEASYKTLAAGSHKRTFAQLQEEVEGEDQAVIADFSLRLSPSPKRDSNEDSEQDSLFQRDLGSPMEASPADLTGRFTLKHTLSAEDNRRDYIVRRLVVEPDSQTSSQCSAASQELETEARAEDPPQTPTVSSKQDPQSPLTDSEVTKPSRNHHKRTSKSCTCKLYNNAKESKEIWSFEESYFTSRKSSGSNESTISNSGRRRRKWTESETQKLKEGVKKFGEGNWSKIKAYYILSDRTNVNLKDRWRTLKKLNMV